MTELPELDVRRRIYAFVSESPGLHLREIHRKLGIALGTLRYHLDALERGSLLSASRERNRKRYFASGMNLNMRKALAVLRMQGPRAVALHLLEHPGATLAELSNATKASKTSTRMYLDLLGEYGLLAPQGTAERGRYVLADPAFVANILRTYRKSFADIMVDRALEIFEDSRWSV